MNLRHDLSPQAWLVPYSHVDADSKERSPLAPRVHRGFFALWHHNGLNKRILAHVRDIVNSRKAADLANLRVIVTGLQPSRARVVGPTVASRRASWA